MQHKLFSINQFDQRLKQVFTNRKFQQIQAKYKERSFYDRTTKIALWLLLLSFGCSVFSAYSEHFYLKDFIQNSINRPQLGLALMVVLIVVIELIKRSTLPSLFQYYFQYGKVDKVSLVIVVVFSGLSIFSSFEGAKLIPAQFMPSPTLVSLDSINQEYATQLGVLNRSIEKQEGTTWQGSITAQANKNIAQLNRQKQQLVTLKNEAVSTASAQNNELMAAYQLSLIQSGHHIGYATLVCECLLFLIIGFLEYRDFTVFALKNNPAFSSALPTHTKTIATTFETPPTPTLPAKKEAKEEEDGKRGKIGFKTYEETSTPNDDRCETKEVVVEVHHGDRVRNCRHCDEQFTYLHWNKQYCSTNCRVLAWEQRTGKRFRKKPRLE